MRDVRTNAESEAFHAGGEGLVFNHFTSGAAGARDNVLHSAGCPQVGKMLIRARPQSRPSVRKVLFATAEEGFWNCSAARIQDRVSGNRPAE